MKIRITKLFASRSHRSEAPRNWHIPILLVSFFLNIILWLFVAYYFRPSSDPVALHYNIYFSIDQFGLWYKAYIMPALGLFVLMLNGILGLYMYKKDVLVSYFLFSSAAILQVILLFAVFLIVTYI